MTQIFKSIIDKIIWAKLDIKDVVKAYEKEFKERKKYQQEIDDAQPGAQEAKKNRRAPEGPDPVDENDLVSPVEEEVNPAEEPDLEPVKESE